METVVAGLGKRTDEDYDNIADLSLMTLFADEKHKNASLESIKWTRIHCIFSAYGIDFMTFVVFES